METVFDFLTHCVNNIKDPAVLICVFVLLLTAVIVIIFYKLSMFLLKMIQKRDEAAERNMKIVDANTAVLQSFSQILKKQ